MLKIYNTTTKQKQNFKPLHDKQVGFYHCGPTVYWTQHIGNLRAVVLADLINRSLNYLGYKVKLVRNYTDVGHLTSDSDEGQDKMEKSAQQEKLTPEQIADKYIKIYEQDVKDLNVLEPFKKPKATDHIKEMIKMVQILIDKGYAYATDLAIYYDVSKFEDYTKLNKQDLSKNISAAGKGEVGDPGKRNSADFALWFFKAGTHKNALQTWKHKFKNIEQTTDEGFPGWHIECSAMSQKYLGDTLDIHMGGVEHIPVHHTNEIAQSEAVTGKIFTNYWVHNEHLTVDGGKMSKSLGTSYSLEEIRQKGYDPLVLRYFYLGAHYRSKQNFTWEALESANNAYTSLKNKLASISKVGKVNREWKEKFTQALEDDFNLPQALAIVWDLFKSDVKEEDIKATILDMDKVLGLDLDQEEKIPKEIIKLAEDRLKAKADKDYDLSDKLRAEIENHRYVIEDTKEGYNLKKK